MISLAHIAFSTSIFFILSSQPLLSIYSINPFLLSLLLSVIYLLSITGSLHLIISKHERFLFLLSFALLIGNLLINQLSSGSLALILFLFVIFTASLLINALSKSSSFRFLLLIQLVILLCASIALVAHLILSANPYPITQDLFNERIYYWMPFSFSVADGDLNATNMYRPSGIYDEPGALFYSSALISILLLLTKKKENMATFLIVYTTLISGSFAGFVLSFLVILSRFKVSTRNFLISLAIFLLFLIAITQLGFINSYVSSAFISRFDNFQTQGLFEGRTSSVLNSLPIFQNLDYLLQGAPKGDEVFRNTGGDPFTILVGFGLFPWLIYLYMMFTLFRISITRLISHSSSDYLFISASIMFGILLQRPYIYHIFWCIPTVMVFLVICRHSNSRASPSPNGLIQI